MKATRKTVKNCLIFSASIFMVVYLYGLFCYFFSVEVDRNLTEVLFLILGILLIFGVFMPVSVTHSAVFFDPVKVEREKKYLGLRLLWKFFKIER